MRRLSLIVLLATALAAPLSAQGQPPPPAPPATGQPTPQQPPPSGQRGGGRGAVSGQPPATPPTAGRGAARFNLPEQNVRLDVAITDSAEKTQRKVVTMLMADRESGRIRSTNNVGVLNVDGSCTVASDGRIHVHLTIEYMPDRSAATTNLNQSISLMVTAGKPTLISQSADPGTDRKVAVEVTATVVK